MSVTISKTFAGKRILLAEDNEFLRKALTTFLQSRGFSVTVAPNGKVAKELIELEEFDVILSDVQMPFLDGVELLKWIKANRPTPVVMMTAFTNLLETQTAHDLGASDFISKPFKNTELTPILERLIFPESSQKQPETPTAEGFCKVSIEEFVAKPKIDFDVYVQLSETKIIKIGHAGDNLPTERIHAYREKGLKYLYIRREDFKKLVAFNVAISKVVATSDSVSREKKLNFMRFTGEVILEKAFVDGVDAEGFSDAKEMLATTVNVLTDGPEQLALLDVLNAHSDWVYAHSIAASMFALMIARKMGHSSSQTFFKLGMAGLFHEIGYKEIPRELIDKPRPLLSQTERAMVETHVSRSREILSVIKGIPGDVIEIVYQHHEDMLGHGYPRRLTRDKIHPLARIFQAADIFADAAIKGPQHPGMPGAQALTYVETFHGDKIDPEVLKSLKSIFNQGASKKG